MGRAWLCTLLLVVAVQCAAASSVERVLRASVQANRAGQQELAVHHAQQALDMLQQHHGHKAALHTHNARLVLAMSLKALGRRHEAMTHLLEPLEPLQHVAVAELAFEGAGNASAVLAHLLMGADALRDGHWKLLAETLGAFGLWAEAGRVVERCVAMEGCTFAGRTDNLTAVQSALLRYHRDRQLLATQARLLRQRWAPYPFDAEAARVTSTLAAQLQEVQRGELRIVRQPARAVFATLFDLLHRRVARDWHWKLLVEALAACGLGRDVRRVLDRCVALGCSFAAYGTFAKHGAVDSEAVRDALLMYHNGTAVPKVLELQGNLSAVAASLDSDPFFAAFARPHVWSQLRELLEGFVHPLPASLLEQGRADHESMARLQQRNETEDRKLWLDAEAVRLGFWQVAQREGRSVLRYRGTPFECLTLPYLNVTECLVYARLWSQSLHAWLHSSEQPMVHVAPQSMPAVLRVGLFTSDLNAHAMLPLLNAFIRHRPRAGYHLHVFHAKTDVATYASLLALADGATDVERLTDAQLLAEIRARNVHVLVDAMGITQNGRPQALAYWQPAPVQVLWAGYPASMGTARSYQYMVADAVSVPPEATPGYAEKMIYLPGSWLTFDHPLFNVTTYPWHLGRANNDNGDDGVGGAAKTVSFCNFGRVWKFDDATLLQWCQIVRQVPGSRLVVVAKRDPTSVNTTQTILRFWEQQCGLEPHRFVRFPLYYWDKYLPSLMETCDVMLDTPNYNMGATAMDALFSRVPVVHMPGPQLKMMSLAAGSTLRAAGVYDELVTRSWAEYRSKAIELATNATTMARVRAKLADAVAGAAGSVLFRPRIDVGALFAGLREAYRLWVDGEQPRHIYTHPLAAKMSVTAADYAHWFGDDPPPFDLTRTAEAVVAVPRATTRVPDTPQRAPLQHALFINLDHRQDRRRALQAEMARLQIAHVERVPAHRPQHRNVSAHQNGNIGCAMSHRRALEQHAGRALSMQPFVAVFEDDWQWLVDAATVQGTIRRFMEAGLEWDVLLLSARGTIMADTRNKSEALQRATEHRSAPTRVPGIHRATATSSSSAYLVRAHYVAALAALLRDAERALLQGQPAFVAALDQRWKALQRRDRWYLTVPVLGRQSPGFSDIDGRDGPAPEVYEEM